MNSLFKEEYINLSIAVEGAPELFTYKAPTTLKDWLCPGVRVHIPLRNKIKVGLIAEVGVEAPLGLDLRSIAGVMDWQPILPLDLVELGISMARGYACSPGVALAALLPGGFSIKAPSCFFLLTSPEETPELILQSLSQPALELYQQVTQKGRVIAPEVTSTVDARYWLELHSQGLVDLRSFCDPPTHALADLRLFATREQPVKGLPDIPPEGISSDKLEECGVTRDMIARRLAAGLLWARPVEPEKNEKMNHTKPELTQEQEEAVDLIREETRPVLLHGVTSSGKTEVYLRLAEETLAEGKSVIVLVPELALTPQTLARFHQRLGESVSELHSGLTPTEKTIHWRRLRRGEARVVLGARSAIFAPLHDVGLIVIDEEHDGSYKQDENPRYWALAVARARAKKHNARLILGSATPSLESFNLVKTDHFALACLNQRIDSRPLPQIELVDLREAPVTDGAPFSATLIGAMEEELIGSGQVMLLLNRRGLHRYALCEYCGEPVTCPSCDISMVYHRGDKLHCHYCGLVKPMPKACPKCTKPSLSLRGYGTQMAEDVLREMFPRHALGRLDTDVTSHRGELERILKAFSSGELRILVGTQMIAKGHDFPQVGLVGILDADGGLALPDFRAAERTYSLITQMAGRAGRGKRPGRVIVQSYHPGHYAVLAAAHYHREVFYQQEMEIRARFHFPPFVRLVQFLVEGYEEEKVEDAVNHLAEWIKRKAAKISSGELLGPTTPMLAKLAGRHRRHMLMKGKSVTEVARIAGEVNSYWRKGMKGTAGLRLTVDVDPRGVL